MFHQLAKTKLGTFSRPPLCLPVTASTRDCARRREIQAAIDPLLSKLPALISIHPPYVSSSLPRPTSSTEVTCRYSVRPPCCSAASPDDTNRRPKRKEKRRALTRKSIRPHLLLRLWHPDPNGRGRSHWDMMHVASDVLEVCFKCFTRMLQRSGCCICCKRVSPMFYLFFRRMLQACLSVCCKVFYLDVTYVCNSFQFVFKSVSFIFFICCKRYIWMFQK
jgi:hypothetical protein